MDGDATRPAGLLRSVLGAHRLRSALGSVGHYDVPLAAATRREVERLDASIAVALVYAAGPEGRAVGLAREGLAGGWLTVGALDSLVGGGPADVAGCAEWVHALRTVARQ